MQRHGPLHRALGVHVKIRGAVGRVVAVCPGSREAGPLRTGNTVLGSVFIGCNLGYARATLPGGLAKGTACIKKTNTHTSSRDGSSPRIGCPVHHPPGCGLRPNLGSNTKKKAQKGANETYIVLGRRWEGPAFCWYEFYSTCSVRVLPGPRKNEVVSSCCQVPNGKRESAREREPSETDQVVLCWVMIDPTWE